jgi:cation/acetate symporter
VYFKGIFIAPLAENIPQNWLFGISPEGIGSVGMLLNFIVAIVVAKLTPAPPEHIQKLVERIRIPKTLDQY